MDALRAQALCTLSIFALHVLRELVPQEGELRDMSVRLQMKRVSDCGCRGAHRQNWLLPGLGDGPQSGKYEKAFRPSLSIDAFP
jgi:hypothetical protein